MNNVLKGILITAIPSVIVGIIVGLVTYRLNAPEKPTVAVFYQYVRAPLPILPAAEYADLDALAKKYGLSWRPSDTAIHAKYGDAWLITIQVRNDSNLK